MAERKGPAGKMKQFIRVACVLGAMTFGAAVLYDQYGNEINPQGIVEQIPPNLIPKLPLLPSQAYPAQALPAEQTTTPPPLSETAVPVLPATETAPPQEAVPPVPTQTISGSEVQAPLIDTVLETSQHAAIALQQAVDSVSGIESVPRKPGRYELAPIAGPSVVRVVFVQNDGSHDPVTDPAKQLWSESEKQEQVNQLKIAAEKWFQISKGNMPITIDAVMDGHTGYQADKMKQSDQNMWLSEVMRSMGYNNPDVFESVYQLDNEIRDKYNTLGATTVFFLKAENPLTPDNYRSIAYEGGPFVIVRVNEKNGLTWMIVRHEFGHALADLPDLYNFLPGTACDEEHGYSNKKYRSEGSDAGHTKDGTKRPCKEAGTPDWMRSLDADTLSLSSQEAAGIIDDDPTGYNTNAAGKLTVSVDANISADGKTLQFSGHAHIQQEIPGSGGQPLELNTIKSMDAQSGSNKQPAHPSDEAFDSADETFSGSIPFNLHLSTSLIIYSTIGGMQTIQITEKKPTSNEDPTYLPLVLN